jgi:nitrite reductase/ring-hydroxylating ferredoxin subunit
MGAGRPAARGMLIDMSRVLCKLDEIAEGEARAFGPFVGAAAKAFVVRKGGRIHAYWDACPHYGDTPMAWRTNAYLNVAGDRIVCASHGAEFEIETGRCLVGAALGKSLTPAPIEATAGGELVLRE